MTPHDRGFEPLIPLTQAILQGFAYDECPYCAAWPSEPCAFHRYHAGAGA